MTTPFVYRIREKSSGKMYVGVKTAKNCHPNMLGRKEKGYWTSSKEVSSNWKNDPDSFEILDIIVLNTVEEAMELEEFILIESGAVDSDLYFNLSVGGYKFSSTGIRFSKDRLVELSKRHKGKKLSKEHILAIVNANSGRKRTSEAKQKTSISLKGNRNAARTYKFISPEGEEFIVKGLKHFIKEHSLPDRNTVVKFLNLGKVPVPDQYRGEKRDNFIGWEIMTYD